MRPRSALHLTIGAFGVLLLVSVLAASTASNTVPGTKIGQQFQAINANALKPAVCAALNLTTILSGTGNITGTAANELILGGPNNQTIKGDKGDDCILGGAGDDTIDGGGGTDICIGGPGTDTFKNCTSSFQ
jgi:Ca2+-binding RTX toxin-like protein